MLLGQASIVIEQIGGPAKGVGSHDLRPTLSHGIRVASECVDQIGHGLLHLEDRLLYKAHRAKWLTRVTIAQTIKAVQKAAQTRQPQPIRVSASRSTLFT